MGSWSLQRVGGQTSPFDDGTLFGNNLICHFRLIYKKSLGRFKEAPRLYWHEKIIMLEHHKRQRWVFEVNMYDHNPNSRTLEVWSSRYIDAYNNAGGVALRPRGSSTLIDREGNPVPADRLRRATNNGAKADAVRDYLKDNGGGLLITIHDIPSINAPRQVTPPGGSAGSLVWEHKERLLLFDCGVLNQAARFKASQHLEVDGASPKTGWRRRAPLAWEITDLPLPPGYTDVPPPPEVATPRNPVFFDGEGW